MFSNQSSPSKHPALQPKRPRDLHPNAAQPRPQPKRPRLEYRTRATDAYMTQLVLQTLLIVSTTRSIEITAGVHPVKMLFSKKKNPSLAQRGPRSKKSGSLALSAQPEHPRALIPVQLSPAQPSPVQAHEKKNSGAPVKGVACIHETDPSPAQS